MPGVESGTNAYSYHGQHSQGVLLIKGAEISLYSLDYCMRDDYPIRQKCPEQIERKIIGSRYGFDIEKAHTPDF